MMGSGGGNSDTGAHGAAATQALASLLDIISNPSAATATLKELTAKSVQVQNQLEQLEQQRLAIEIAQKEALANQQKAMRIQKETEDKESHLVLREMELYKTAAALDAHGKFLETSKIELDKKKQEHSQREQALMRLEKESADRAATTLADAEKVAAERKSIAQSVWQSAVTDANKLNDEANTKHETAASVLAEAEAKKQLYEKRLASLKQLALGD